MDPLDLLTAVLPPVATVEDFDELAGWVVHRAADLLPGATTVTVTLHADAGGPRCRAASDPLGRALVDAQRRAGDGPCVQSMRQGALVVAGEGRFDRWPAYAPAAAQHRLRSHLAAPLTLEVDRSPRGTVAVYSREVAVIGSDTLRVAEAVALALGLQADRLARRQDLQQRLEAASLVGRATGVLQERHRCGADRARQLLEQAAERLGGDLAAAARQVHESPPGAPPRAPAPRAPAPRAPALRAPARSAPAGGTR